MNPSPAQLLQAFYLLATISALSANAIPALREGLLIYGARSSTADAPKTPPAKQSDSPASKVLKLAGQLQVSHSWFIHFYIISVLSSIFWASQICTNGFAFQLVASLWLESRSHVPTSMTLNQVALTWLLVATQGGRRLYESMVLTKPSNSKMPVLSWLIGIAFYVAVGMSVWVEGIPALVASNLSSASLDISIPSWKALVGVPLFIVASAVQNECHTYLASLKKYSLPRHPYFERLLCPHYTAEYMIYVALTIVSAPKGQLINKTMALALIFTTTNLGVTAESSREWTAQKFGKESIQCRWRMIPLIF